MPGHVAQQRSPRPDNFRAVGLEEPCYARQTFFLQTNQLAHCVGHLGGRTEMSHDFYSQENTTGMMYGARQTWLHYKISICIIPSSATIVPLTLSFSPLHRHLQSQPHLLWYNWYFCPLSGAWVGTDAYPTDIPKSWSFTPMSMFPLPISTPLQLPAMLQVIGCGGIGTANGYL